MKKIIALFIAAITLCAAGSVLAETPDNDAGITYTFKGGSWADAYSWEPQNVPGINDNAVIPAGLTATAPKTCELGTLTVSGSIEVSTLLVKTFEVTSTGTMSSTSEMSLDCRGTVKNTGQIIAAGKLSIIALGFENSGTVKVSGICDWRILGTMTNLGTIDSKKTALIQASRIINSGIIKTGSDNANIILWSLNSIENNGSLLGYNGITSSTGLGEQGGSVYLACQNFTGTGVIAPGNGGDGNPPGKKGVALVGATYDPAAFSQEMPPTGTLPDDSTWKAQTVKATPRDGRKTGESSSGNLTLTQPANSRPFAYGGLSAIINNTGGTVSASIKWSGDKIVRIKGNCSADWVDFWPKVMYLNKGETFPVTLRFPQRNTGSEELKISFETDDGLTYVSMRLTVFFIKCPIIKGNIRSRDCLVTDDKGNTTPKRLSTAPMATGKTIFVPLRDFIEINGGTVVWDNTAKKATVTMPGRTITIGISVKTATTNGVAENIGSNTYLSSGKLMIPADSLAGMIGASFRLDGKSFLFKYPG